MSPKARITTRTGAVAAVGLMVAAMAAAGVVPEAVSPGSAEALARVGDICPTFSWTAAPDAERYELVIYVVGDSERESEEVLRRGLPGGATNWTPSLEACLERSGRYAWSVRAMGRRPSEWSAPALFEVASGPSEAEFEAALEIVRQYVTEDGVVASSDDQGSASTGVRQSTAAATSGLQAADPPAPLAPALAGDSDLMVNGSAVVTTATLGAGLCEALSYRFFDQGDGTVLDCNTGKIWLKDANCDGEKNWQAAKDWAENLASGSCGLTDGSEAGEWHLPEFGEFWSGNASDSLLNTNFSFPALGNSAGNGQWAADDAFVGVQGVVYWSASELYFGSMHAYDVNLGDGAIDVDGKSIAKYVWPVRGGQ